jgi:hypothetical protein|tara:strand:+ start:317 stop:550 length:234 start_codon:yes stop_codon:yes gene_type:complete
MPEISKTRMLRETMYRMFKNDTLPYLDMEDFILMWETLADSWNVRMIDNNWEDFAEEINSQASNREAVFNEIFDKYF